MQAAEVIFKTLIAEKRSVIISALMKGADLSHAGASTYYQILKSREHTESSNMEQAPLIEQVDRVAFSKAIEEARNLRSNGSSKMQAAEVIFKTLIGEKRSVIISALMKGAELSHAGASTYYQTLKSR
jgi:predicted transcriptional regulator